MIRWFNKIMRNKKGFTLIELIVVIAILGILAAIAVPRFGEIQLNSKWKADIATATVIGKAAEVYYIDTGIVPDSIGDLGNYLDDTSIQPQLDGATGFYLDFSDESATVYYDDDDEAGDELYPEPASTRPTF